MKTRRYFTTVEIVFLSSMIGLDFAYGLVVGPILTATGILELIRVDMVLPVTMMLVTRLVVDKFGTLIVYELAWGILAVLAKPTSFGAIPGFMKIVPAVAYGIVLDSFMQLFPRRLLLRVTVAAVAGGFIYQFVFLGIRLLFGVPWSTAVQVLLGVNILTNIVVNLLAAYLTVLVWRGVESSGWVRRIRSWRSS